MQLHRWELEPVASGIAELSEGAAASPVRPEALATALCEMPAFDRAPVWELAVRRFGRRKPLAQAAGEIGMDALRGHALLAAFSEALAAVVARSA